MDKKSSLMAFMLGMAVGSVVTWKTIKNRYERRIEEDRKSLEEMYAAKRTADAKKKQEENPPSDPQKIAEQARDKPDISEYTRRIQGEGYLNYANGENMAETKKEPPRTKNVEIPYVISPDEFGEMVGYEKISMTYFSDGVLTDENNEPLDDVEEIIGDGLEHFGEYEADSVFVRNDAKKCDYEILRDLREFSEVATDY